MLPRPVSEPASKDRGEIDEGNRQHSVMPWKAHCFGQRFRWKDSCENFSDHPRRFHARQFLFQALKPVVQLVVIEAEQIEHRRVQVANLNWIFDDFVSHFIGLSMADARPHAATRQQYREGTWIRIAAYILHLLPASVFSHWCAAEFSTPNYQCVFEHASRFEVGYQCR